VNLSSGKGQDFLCSHATVVPHQVDFNAKPNPLALIQVEGHVKGDVWSETKHRAESNKTCC